MGSDLSLWKASRATAARLPDMDAVRWKGADGWSAMTWGALGRASASDRQLEDVVAYLAALSCGAPAALAGGAEVPQRDAVAEAVRLGERLGVGPRDRVLALSAAWTGPWLRALWLGLVHGCPVHLGGPAVLDEVRPTAVVREEDLGWASEDDG